MSTVQQLINLIRRPVILAIVGQSGSGKTTMADIMAQHGIPTIVSYTTRPMRDGEVNGKDHWFVSADSIPPREKMLAWTKFNEYEYWANISQVKRICSYVVDEKGLKEMKKKYSYRYIIFSIYIDRPLENRLESGIEKERCDRDNDRELLDQEQYDYIIHNNYTLEEFTNKIIQFTNSLYQ